MPESAPLRPINEVMNAHVDRIMALEQVVMVAIGELDDGTPCIQVYVTPESDTPLEAIGREIEGHPVVYLVSDEIRPLD